MLARSSRRQILLARRQFAGVVITVLIGVALFAASYDAYLNLEVSYQQTYDRLEFADLVVTGGDVEDFAGRAVDLDGVAAVTTRRQGDIPIRVGGDHVLLGRVVEVPDDGQPAVNRLDVIAGSWPAVSARGVLAERHLASHFGLAPDGSLDIHDGEGWSRVAVAGTAVSAEYLWPARSRQDVLTSPDDFGVVFASATTFDALTGTAGRPLEHQALTRFAPDADADAVTAALTELARVTGASYVQPRADQPSHAALQEDVAGFGEMSFLFPVLFLGAASMATFVFLSRLVRSERTEIAMLRANGVSTRDVAVHYAGQGIVVTGLAGVLGAGVGAVVGWAVTGFYTEAISVPDTVTEFRPATMIVGVVLAVVAGAAASAGPAAAAARTPPGLALRGFSAPTTGRGGGGRGRPHLTSRLPARWRMVLRGIGRDRRRSFSTGLGVVLAMTLVLTSWGMLDTVQILLERQFEQVQLDDARIVVERSSPDVIDEIASTPGVERVEEIVSAAVVISSPAGTYATELVGFAADTEMHGFGSSPPTDGVVAGRSLAGILDIEAGDTVRIDAGGGSGADLRVDGFVDEPLGTLAYADIEVARSLVPLDGTTELLVRAAPGIDREQLRAAITSVDGVVAYTDTRALYQTARDLMALFSAIVGVMLVFGAIMAVTLVYNTMTANAVERTAELAGLRVNGASARRLARLLAAENLVLTMLALIPGCLVGWLVSWVFMESFSSDLFDFGLRMRWRTPVLASLALLFVGALLQRPASKLMASLDISRVVRQRSS